MKDLRIEIIRLSNTTNYNLDPLELDMDLTLAMDESQREDLKAMIDYLKTTDTPEHEIFFNVIHDLRGLRAVHVGHPTGVGFFPRSKGYAEKIKNQKGDSE